MSTNTQTTVQVRIDMFTKRAAQRTLEAMGLDLSSGMKLFLRNVAITQSIPFQIRTANNVIPEKEKRMIIKAIKAEKGKKQFYSGKVLLGSI